MSRDICNFREAYGEPPYTCPELQTYLRSLISASHAQDQMRVGQSSGMPTQDDLTSLWGGCYVPPNAVATWYNTTDVEYSQWFTELGSGPFHDPLWQALTTHNTGSGTYEYWEKLRAIRYPYAVGIWPLIETTGTVVYDYSDNNYDGAYSGATPNGTTFTPTSDPAPTFNGTSDYINLYTAPLASALNCREHTYSIWVKVNSSGTWTDGTLRSLSDVYVSAADRIYLTKETGGQIKITYVANSVTKTVTSAVQSTTNWLHIAYTVSYANNNLELYVNGSSVGSASSLGQFSGTAPTRFYVGTINNTFGYWKDALSHACWWNTPFTSTQISTISSP